MSATEMAPLGPEVEVVTKARHRRFTAEYKRKIVREADPVYDAAQRPGGRLPLAASRLRFDLSRAL
jgi:hypothetical protein